MSNPLSEVRFNAEGGEYILVLRNSTIVALEKGFKKPLLKVMQEEPSTEDLLTVFRAALKANHPDLAADAATDLVSIGEVVRLIGELLPLTYGAGSKDEVAENPQMPGSQTEAGTGPAS